MLNESFGESFNVDGFTETNGIWTKTDGANFWIFNEATGNLALATGYSKWAVTHAGGQGADFDFDGNGVANGAEYFMGISGSSLALLPGPVTSGGVMSMTWPRDPAATVDSFEVQYSTTLGDDWTAVPAADVNLSDPTMVVYTFPSSLAGRCFVRLSVQAEPIVLQPPVPYSLLNPPVGISPAITREPYSWSFGTDIRQYPKQEWTKTERAAYEAKVDWFHRAKFGVFFHYLAGGQWNTTSWNQWVNSVDVERVADQAQELGAGYVIISLGQNQIYSCAPNPVIDQYWGPGYTSQRDLPMELGLALQARGIPMMLYFATDNQYQMPRPATFTGTSRYTRWLEVAQWYSDHYGTLCKGWWVDGLTEFIPDYCIDMHEALKHGNADALVTSGQHELSDFIHGHCMPNWARQSSVVKPFFGRWDPDFKVQWHVFQYIGDQWGRPGCSKITTDLVNYARDVVRGGGVITFDIGTFTEGCFWSLPPSIPTGIKSDGTRIGPFLYIPEDQMQQLRAVRDALQSILPSDGSGK
jgi:hypothetical protein